MRILFFSNEYPNPLDPTRATFNASLVNALAQTHAVRVVSPITWKDELTARILNGTCLDVGKRQQQQVEIDFVRYYHVPGALRPQYGRFLWWSVRRPLVRTMADFRPDCIVSYWAHPDGEVAVKAARRFRIPAIVMVGGSDILLLARHGKRRRAILKVLNAADAVVAVSGHLAQRLEDDGISTDRIHVIHRGVNRSVFFPGSRSEARRRLGIDADATILVAVGRLVPVKDFATIVSACRHLVDANVRIHCYLIGDGPLNSALERQINALSLGKTVELTGSRPPKELAEWYRAANLTLLSSRSEGIPNVLLESMACGSAFVATEVGGIPEIADPQYDRLVPPGDAMAYSRAVDDVLQRPRPSSERRFQSPSWEESAERMTSVMAHLV